MAEVTQVGMEEPSAVQRYSALYWRSSGLLLNCIWILAWLQGESPFSSANILCENGAKEALFFWHVSVLSYSDLADWFPIMAKQPLRFWVNVSPAVSLLPVISVFKRYTILYLCTLIQSLIQYFCEVRRFYYFYHLDGEMIDRRAARCAPEVVASPRTEYKEYFKIISTDVS